MGTRGHVCGGVPAPRADRLPPWWTPDGVRLPARPAVALADLLGTAVYLAAVVVGSQPLA